MSNKQKIQIFLQGILVFLIAFTSIAKADDAPDWYIGRVPGGLHAPSIITQPYQLGMLFGNGNMIWYEQGENGISDSITDGGVVVNELSYKNQGMGYRYYTDINLWFLNFNWFTTYNKYRFNLEGSARVDDGSNPNYGTSITSSLNNTTTVGCFGIGSSWNWSILQLGIDWGGYCKSNSISNQASNSANDSAINADLNAFGSDVVSKINEWDKLLIVYIGIVF